MSKPTLQDVRTFWEANPLFEGETAASTGSQEYFAHHRDVYVNDCFAGRIDERIFPALPPGAKVLDLGCGPGFWTESFALRGYTVVGADLTRRAAGLARTRCELAGKQVPFAQQNAEQLGFADASFDHVNCQGVIHHSPRPDRSVAEIARVLKPGGSALLSVYYKNLFLRAWPVLRPGGRLLAKLGGKLAGRGREQIFEQGDVSEIVRLYDGADNPLGIAFDRREFTALVSPHFAIEDLFLHFFPARALPVRLPRALHRSLDRHAGFLIFGRLRKR